MATEKNILSKLFRRIRNLSGLSLPFNYIGQYEALSPVEHLVHSNSTYYREPMEQLFGQLGIRSVAINNLLNSFILPKSFCVPCFKITSQPQWRDFKITSFVEDLKRVFRNSWVVVFSEWTIVDKASEIWKGLLSDVIKPLDRKDFNFIFQLGEPARKLNYEIEEVLDTLKAFSFHGQVTLILTEYEATKLWTVLHDPNYNKDFSSVQIPDPTDKYHLIFETIHISHLVIYSGKHVTLFTGKHRYIFHVRSNVAKEISREVWDNFNAGYGLGLLLQLETSQCIALGLTVSGASMENKNSPDPKALLSYIERWIWELNQSQKGLVYSN